MKSFFAVALSTLLTTVNPVESLGPFLALTMGSGKDLRRRIARRATLVSSGILLVSALAGGLIFKVFGISLPAFRIAGGLLLFTVGLKMLNAQDSSSKEVDGDKDLAPNEDIAIFPLAIPLIAGPGAIASILILSERANDLVEYVSLYGALLATQLTLYIVLSNAERISNYLGPMALKVLNRLMGLILAALAVQFVLDGIKEALPGLGR